MANFWLVLFKRKGFYAKWLIFLTLVVTLLLGAAGYFEATRQYIDTDVFTFTVGDFSISLYGVLRAILVISLIFWITATVSDVAEKRVNKIEQLGSANKALLLKVMHIIIYLIAFLIALDMMGLDLTALTVFSGALGIGIGFGLQRISSNFISGIILLLEKSIELDDLIELTDGTFGFIRKASARYTLLETFDGREILVPNEDLITSRVINWTFTNSRGRIEISIGVSYDSDLEKAREIILECAKEHPRCIEGQEPKCFLVKFGDNSIDFVLHFWVEDISMGSIEPKSDVMFEIWRKFKENNIEIPFPQRDLHLKTPTDIKIITNAE